MARLFGTDGVRGLANRDLTADLALKLGKAAAFQVLHQDWDCADQAGQESRPRLRAIVGRDTRISGDFLDHAISAGLAAAGVDVTRVGVVTTPCVAFLTAEADFDLGVMISASHNPMPDNGIKFFAKGGYKLPDTVEDQIEQLLDQDLELPVGAEVGRIDQQAQARSAQYVEHLVKNTPSLAGLKIAVDCANGAASKLGPAALEAAGAQLVVLNAQPNGENINLDCGSTHPEQLQAAVVEHGCDFGVAFDGDADRCLAVDHAGNLVDGDKIMGLLAMDLKEQGKLANDTLVITVMSNLGLILAMQEQGINTVQTAVGDRYVLEEMLKDGHTLGGEQSGHVINTLAATTGDGILTALCLAAAVKRAGKPLSDLTAFVKRLPQTLINVPNVDKNRTNDPQLVAAISQAEAELGQTGRVLLRASGTEPLIRVMVEAATQEQADQIAADLANIVTERCRL